MKGCCPSLTRSTTRVSLRSGASATSHSRARATFCDSPGEIQPDPLFLSGLACSIGVATLAIHVQNEQSLAVAKSQLLKLSDSAMYRAKEAGRNRVLLAETAADLNSGLARTAAR